MKRKSTRLATEAAKRLKTTKIGVNDLPNEILVMIFKRLTASQRRNAMTVCHKWLALFEEYFPNDNCLILSGNLDYSKDGCLYKTFQRRLKMTKDKRTFSNLLIKSFPKTLLKFQIFAQFIDLIQDEVKILTIQELAYTNIHLSDNFFNEMLYLRMPKLNALNICEDGLLGDLRFPNSLKTIKVQNDLRNLKKLDVIRRSHKIKVLTSPTINIRNQYYKRFSSFIDDNMRALLRKILGNDPSTSIVMNSNFNYCGNTKMSTNDVTSMSFCNGVECLSPAVLGRFKNLKRLHFNIMEAPGPEITTKRVSYTGITHLELFGLGLKPFQHFDKLLQSFPDCEYLVIDGFGLENAHFTCICQYMPKLKTLVLLNGLTDNRISLKTLLERNAFSLHDLKKLEKLVIETTDTETPVDLEFDWPALPKLKELKLVGDCFKYFHEDVYIDMAINCPNITKLIIDTEGAFCSNMHFLSLIYSLNLKHLELPGEGLSFDEIEPNDVLIRNVIDDCQGLETFGLNDLEGFSLKQEITLFSEISSLTMLKCEVTNASITRYRKMSRNDFGNLKAYLKENLQKYFDITATAGFIIENVIPFHTKASLAQFFDFQSLNEPDEVKNLMMVTEFLDLDRIKMCRLLYAIAEM